MALGGRSSEGVLTLDVGLSDISGLELAGRLRVATSAPILMITAFAANTDELNGMAAGADAYLISPFRPAQLRAAVQELNELSTITDDVVEAARSTLVMGIR